jgi:hypothetical protein
MFLNLSETEADEPSRGREIFQQKNTGDDKHKKSPMREIPSISFLY